MNAAEIKNLNWILVTDWSALPQTYFSNWGDTFVSQADVDDFIENVFRDISRRLDIPYSELEPILKEENSGFYSTKSRVFARYDGISKTSNHLGELQKMLKIPDITSIPDNINKSSVDKILNDFSTLTDVEKLEVLQRLGIVSVKVDFLNK